MSTLSIEKLFSLNGKRALVTGASSGLGEYFAKTLAMAGAEVIVAARRADKLKELVKEISLAGGKAHELVLDVTSSESVHTAFEELDNLIPSLDIVINNAGISTQPTRFLDLQESEWGALLEVNLKGAWRVAKQSAIRMKSQKGGTIINIGSIYSHCTGIHKSDYNVSKAAINQLTKNMALELCRSGIRVNSLCPGYFSSEINSSELNTEKGEAYIKKLVPQRVGNYQELAGPLLLLASEAGSYINGSSLVVDGGSLLSPI